MSAADPALPVKPKYRGVSHLIALFVAVGMLFVFGTSADPGQETGAWVFGLGIIILFSGSSLYHIPNWTPEMKAKMRRVDRVAG